MRWLALTILICILLPVGSSIQITEIMYNVEGKDTGFEWIEIYNDGKDIDICSCRLFEADTNHYIKGDVCTFAAGEYIVIADKPENLDFNCNILDSAFNLKNTGEELCIRDAEKTDLFCVTYSSDWGADGNGESLQLVNGEWCSAAPTPGSKNNCEPVAEESEDGGSEAGEVEGGTGPSEEIIEEPKDLAEQSPAEPSDEAEGEQKELEETQEILHAPKEQAAEKITSSVVYESKAQESSNLHLLLLLAVSISLNVLFILSRVKR
jgi:hypothetical protein